MPSSHNGHMFSIQYIEMRSPESVFSMSNKKIRSRICIVWTNQHLQRCRWTHIFLFKVKASDKCFTMPLNNFLFDWMNACMLRWRGRNWSLYNPVVINMIRNFPITNTSTMPLSTMFIVIIVGWVAQLTRRLHPESESNYIERATLVFQITAAAH